MMLMGDARIEEEEEILHSKEICPVYVLKAGHHGSKTSTGDHWLRALRPNIVILSYGKKNRYGHPSKEVLRRLEEAKVRVFSTQKSGAIRLETLLITARFPRVMWKYEGVSYAVILKNVGVLYHALTLHATDLGLASCPVGGGDSDIVADILGSDYFEETTVGEVILGSILDSHEVVSFRE